MKNLLRTTFYIVTIFALAFTSINAKEETIKPKHEGFYKTTVPSYFKSAQGNNNSISNVSFTIIDSMANAFSFYTNDQMPLVYHPESETLVMIKRGFSEDDNGTSIDPKNTKNNLFVRTSTDWGATWSDPELVYDKDTDGSTYPYRDARYPSVYPFTFEEELSYAICSPVANPASSATVAWSGFLTGFKYPNGGFIFYVNEFDHNGTTYSWATTDNRLFAEGEGDFPSILIHSHPWPIEAQRDGTNQSDIGIAKTNDSFSDYDSYIPEQTSSSIFVPVATTQTDFQNLTHSVAAGFDSDDNGNLYSAFAGRIANEFGDLFQPAVSKSTDMGDTWSEPNVFPMSLVFSYMFQEYGVPQTDVSVGTPQGFCTYGEDQYSFVVTVRDTNPSLSELNRTTELVELNYDGSNWSVNRIADETGYIVLFVASDGGTGNQLGREGQLVRTVDGEHLMFKWVDFAVEEQVGAEINRSNYDIFVAFKNVATGEWSEAYNLTETADYERITWVPNMIPNDLKNIPLIRVATRDPQTFQHVDAIDNLVSREVETPQYVLSTQFDRPEVSVENSNTLAELDLYEISPNPATEIANVQLKNPVASNVVVSAYDVTGQLIEVLYDGYLNPGIINLDLNISNFLSGSYILRIEANGKFDTEILKVVR